MVVERDWEDPEYFIRVAVQIARKMKDVERPRPDIWNVEIQPICRGE